MFPRETMLEGFESWASKHRKAKRLEDLSWRRNQTRLMCCFQVMLQSKQYAETAERAIDFLNDDQRVRGEIRSQTRPNKSKKEASSQVPLPISNAATDVLRHH